MGPLARNLAPLHFKKGRLKPLASARLNRAVCFGSQCLSGSLSDKDQRKCVCRDMVKDSVRSPLRVVWAAATLVAERAATNPKSLLGLTGPFQSHPAAHEPKSS